MADDIVLNATVRAAVKSPQSAQGSAQQSLKQAAQSEKAVADLLEQAADDLGAATPTRGNIINTKV
ncbi:MAG: hypothetical protein HQ513_14010 [Rhodospirillales bacterium]|nr:hypothetical protein [Rhodospirillales bacterium]